MSDLYYIIARDSDGAVLQRGVTSQAKGAPAPPTGFSSHELTQAAYSRLTDSLRYAQNASRYRWTGTAVVEQTDPRPILRFQWRATLPAAPGSWLDVDGSPLDFDVGDLAWVRIGIVNDAGSIRSNINRTDRIELGGRLVRLNVASGVSQNLRVPTTAARQIVVGDTDEYRVENPLFIRVFDSAEL